MSTNHVQRLGFWVKPGIVLTGAPVAVTAFTTPDIDVTQWTTKSIWVLCEAQDCTIDIEGKFKGADTFAPFQSYSAGTGQADKWFGLTTNDIFNHIRVKITPGVTPPDKVFIYIYGSRLEG